MTFRWPNNTEHVSVIGQNGSGKTQLAAFLLTKANYSKIDDEGHTLPDEQLYYRDSKGLSRSALQPWIIIDYKLDPLLNHRRLRKRIRELSLSSSIPTEPGLYIVHPRPDEVNAIEDFLWRIWERGKTGVWFDEAHIIPKQEEGAFQAILTQGRSKKIPCVVLTQKPSWVSRFVFSEAKFFSIFHLNDKRDHKTLNYFVPIDLSQPLPKYHSHWYDTGDNQNYLLKPVPNSSTILSAFEHRLPRRWLR